MPGRPAGVGERVGVRVHDGLRGGRTRLVVSQRASSRSAGGRRPPGTTGAPAR
ncbi:hypothetical protein [Ornithinimicrobium kibberense]|uniref:hypothetical protein n=1 Tax=Ornithinimicrobium kibberense TaxID=282060 RepID=UPI00360D4DF6